MNFGVNFDVLELNDVIILVNWLNDGLKIARKRVADGVECNITLYSRDKHRTSLSKARSCFFKKKKFTCKK